MQSALHVSFCTYYIILYAMWLTRSSHSSTFSCFIFHYITAAAYVTVINKHEITAKEAVSCTYSQPVG